MYAAMHEGKYELAQYLKSLGCKEDPAIPLIKKIPNEELETLFKNAESETINIKELLTKAGYAADLSYCQIEVPDKFKFIDFSGMILTEASLFLPNANLSFANANLEGTLVARILLQSDQVDFTGANLHGMFGVIEDKLYNSMPDKANDLSKLRIRSKERYLHQSALTKHYEIKSSTAPEEEGICLGLIFEFGRHILRSEQKNKQGDLAKGFLDKLLTKIEKKSENAIERIKVYQNTLQFELSTFEPLDLESPNTLLNSLKQFSHTNLIALSTEDHAMAIYVHKDDKGNTIHYTIYEPNSGLSSHLHSVEDLYTELTKISSLMEKIRFEGKLYITDLRDMIIQLGFICADPLQYDKNSKNIYKLYKAINAHDIGMIKTLSKSYKIDHLGYTLVSIDVDTDSYLPSYNVLRHAIYNSKEDELITLIENNQKLDFSDPSKTYFILEHLICANKLSEKVLDAIINKTGELGFIDAQNVFDEAKKLKCSKDDLNLNITAEKSMETLKLIAKDFKDNNFNQVLINDEGTELHAQIPLHIISANNYDI